MSSINNSSSTRSSSDEAQEQESVPYFGAGAGVMWWDEDVVLRMEDRKLYQAIQRSEVAAVHQAIRNGEKRQ